MKTALTLTGTSIKAIELLLVENNLIQALSQISENSTIFFFNSKGDAKEALQEASKKMGYHKNQWDFIPTFDYKWRSILLKDIEGSVELQNIFKKKKE